MEEILEIANSKKGNLVTIPITDQFGDLVLPYANQRGITREEAIIELAETALKSRGLMQGKVIEIAPEVLDMIKASQMDALKQFESEKSQHEEPITEQPITKAGEKENEITFTTTSDLKEVIGQINKQRASKGLAPIEKSLAELLFHWARSISDNSVFQETTGLEFVMFNKVIKELALLERSSNEIPSNIIETSGFFGTYKVVDTPQQ